MSFQRYENSAVALNRLLKEEKDTRYMYVMMQNLLIHGHV